MEEKELNLKKIQNLRLRSRIIQSIRDFFIEREFLEVETPVRIPAPAPESHIEAVSSEPWFLQTSPELCMKRLLAGGHERIFQICRCFRKSERGDRHLPEFTMLEWYQAGIDYRELMRHCEDLLAALSRSIAAAESILYQGKRIKLDAPWERISVTEAFDRYTPVSMERALEDGSFNERMAFEIEPRLGLEKPVFLFDYPVSLGALARSSPGDPTVAERFELYMSGLELVNAFSELVDPEEQRTRFSREQAHRTSCGKPVYPDPEKFLNCLNHMPESAGAALGIDRLCMIFADTTRIDDVVAFTTEDL